MGVPSGKVNEATILLTCAVCPFNLTAAKYASSPRIHQNQSAALPQGSNEPTNSGEGSIVSLWYSFIFIG